MFLFIFVCVCVCVCVLGGGTYIFHFCAVNFEVFETFILECSECVRNHLHGHRNERLLCATFVSFWLFDWYNTEKMRGVGGNIYTHTHAYERSFFSLFLSLSLSVYPIELCLVSQNFHRDHHKQQQRLFSHTRAIFLFPHPRFFFLSLLAPLAFHSQFRHLHSRPS